MRTAGGATPRHPRAGVQHVPGESGEGVQGQGRLVREAQPVQSQCFLCDPKLKEKYAARYRLKYGKEPPPVTE